MSELLSLKLIELFEHQENLNTKIKYEELTENDIRHLEQLQKEKKLSYSYTGGSESSLQITSNSFIGSLSLTGPNVRINILPKIFKEGTSKWENIHVFLNYAMNDEFDFLENARHYYDQSSESTFSNILYQTLIIEYENLMKKGLLKSYVIHAENTSSMRGKLLMQHQMLNDAMKRPQFFCEFDELEYDSIENRVILEALTVIERSSDNQNMRMKSMDLAQRLSGLVEKTSVPRLARKRMMQSYNRQNLRYQRIHQICDQIIDKSGIDDIYRGDNSYVVPVFYDMNELFESFVQKLFQWHYQDSELRVETQFSKKAWKGYDDLGDRNMRPDITIWDGEICKHIIDVKYKTKKITTGDLYQLGFYIHEFSELNKHFEERIENAIAITPKFTDAKSGIYESRTGKQVFVKRIDVDACLDIMKTSNWDPLKPIIESWIKPNEHLN
jgi:5-methylcytosine-specific restriction endonuclease McrBC regulatory subunit McrC